MEPEAYLLSKVRRKYSKNKRVYEKRKFTVEELKAYWLNNGILSKRHLEKIRQPHEPAPYDYIKIYGSFSKARQIITCNKKDFFCEYRNPDKKFFVELVENFNIKNKSHYKRWRYHLPEVFPSVHALEKVWLNWSNLRYFSEVYSKKGTMQKYLNLAIKIGRVPSYFDCEQYNLPISHLVKKFKGKRHLDSVLKMLLDYMA